MVGKAKRPRLHCTAPRSWSAWDPPPLPERGPSPSPGTGLDRGAGGWTAAAGKVAGSGGERSGDQVARAARGHVGWGSASCARAVAVTGRGACGL